MAPTAPKTKPPSSSQPTGAKRQTARQKALARLADPLLPRKLHRADNTVTDSFLSSKHDKQLIKHSTFLSRVAKSSSKSTTKTLKRRRPNKKLVATLSSLGDALDDIRAELDEQEASGDVMDAEQARQGKVRHKSLKSRPGALKRKERLVKGEMARFGQSLAQLANVSVASSTAEAGAIGGGGAAVGEEGKMEVEAQAQTATSSRWAALRGFISATMEQNPAFLNKT
ncbi:ribosome biogenesis protein SLX9-domain-containing protein [Staphylotrichum tortipilum]|uniref:Ribosome biogenesis protein SLX9 n=1 Tax=Staphylotrichum tortipilum TaxID=2831512 RepID=A0AAN6MP56_9PEZI|nr:ribosome biogenesis protein SLX9-domain-containing protein [Staphylotrichum longicolle]